MSDTIERTPAGKPPADSTPSESPYESARYRSLAGRSVVVTGGASGIGVEIVRAFVAQGSRVSFLDIDRPTGASVEEETGARFVECDLTDIAALRAALAMIESEAGAIDVLVNNAGCDDRHEVDDVDLDQWRRTLAVNLDHQFFATQAVAKGMAGRGGGSVILLGSVSWMRGRTGMIGYTTAKAAINGMNRSLAHEFGEKGIRVNCIVPGAIITERQQTHWLTPEKNQEFIDLQALKFRLDGTHVARLALFLGSEESAGCTGANFVVDAGLTQN